VGVKNPDAVAVKLTGVPKRTALLGEGVVTDMSAFTTVITCEAVALLPRASLTVTVIVCEPISSLLGCQDNAPCVVICELFTPPGKESITVKVGLVNPEVKTTKDTCMLGLTTPPEESPAIEALAANTNEGTNNRANGSSRIKACITLVYRSIL
jgi:hypothetical protein